METRIIKVYDTISKKMVDVEVSQEIYQEYKQSIWREEKNDASFYEHEIQFSMLIGGGEGAFENFREFIADNDPSSEYADKTEIVDKLKSYIGMLKEQESVLMKMIYFQELSEQECATVLRTSRQNIHNKHKRILAKIHKLMKG